MSILSLNSNLQPLSASYTADETIILNSYKNVTTEGFNFSTDALFVSALDAKINNYSGVYLSNESLGTDLFSMETLIPEYPYILNTTLVNNSLFLSLCTTNYTKFTFALSSTPNLDINLSYFEVEFVDNVIARIAHQTPSNRYYLTHLPGYDIFSFQPGLDLNHTTPTVADNDVFYYIFDETLNYLSLFKSNANNQLCIMQYGNYGSSMIGLNPILSGSNNVIFNSGNVLQVNNYIQHISPKFNTSWVSYDNTDANAYIANPSKSRSNIPSNFLVHTEYSSISGLNMNINLLNLKNTYTHKNNSYRSNYIEMDPVPVKSKTYNALHTGNNQELGNSEIVLGFEFYNTDYTFGADGYTIFYTSDNLYPFDSLNINNTLFAKSGAIAGDSPYTSDKIFWKRTVPNDNLLLCTWLSGNIDNVNYIWVDRYYNPTKSTYLDALSEPNATFIDPAIAFFPNLPYFDKISDLVFLPNQEYIYQRIGNKYVQSIIDAISSALVTDSVTLYNTNGTQCADNTLYTGSQYGTIQNYNTVNTRSSFTLGLTIDSNNWQAGFGNQLIGNLNDMGFGILNDQIITPFIQIQNGSSIYVYNTDFKLLDQVEINPLYVALTATNNTLLYPTYELVDDTYSSWAALNTTGTFTLTPNAALSGIFTIPFYVVDICKSTEQYLNVTVGPNLSCNYLPQITSGLNATVTVGYTATYQLSGLYNITSYAIADTNFKWWISVTDSGLVTMNASTNINPGFNIIPISATNAFGSSQYYLNVNVVENYAVGQFQSLYITSNTVPEPNRVWTNIAAAPNGDIYAVANVDAYYKTYPIYKKLKGTTDFIAINGTYDAHRWWKAIAVAPNGDVYVAEDNYDIWKMAAGTTTLQAMNQRFQTWSSLYADPVTGDVYATTYGPGGHVRDGDIYVLRSGDTTFTSIGEHYADGSSNTIQWYEMGSTPNASTYYVNSLNWGPLSRSGTSGLFSSLNQPAAGPNQAWYSIACALNGDVYAGMYNGDIWKQTGGVGNFVATGQTTRNWISLAVDPTNGDIYAADATPGGGIYILPNSGNAVARIESTIGLNTSIKAGSTSTYQITALYTPTNYALANNTYSSWISINNTGLVTLTPAATITPGSNYDVIFIVYNATGPVAYSLNVSIDNNNISDFVYSNIPTNTLKSNTGLNVYLSSGNPTPATYDISPIFHVGKQANITTQSVLKDIYRTDHLAPAGAIINTKQTIVVTPPCS